MCEPTTIMLGVSLAVAAVSAVGAIQQGNAAEAAGDAAKANADQNAARIRLDAEDARKRGLVAAGTKRKEGALLIAQQRVAFAANGVVVDEGSALDITTDTAGLAEHDALTLINNSEREATNLVAESVNIGNQGTVSQFGGQQAQSASRLQAFGTLLGGAANAYADYDFGTTSTDDFGSSGFETGVGRSF